MRSRVVAILMVLWFIADFNSAAPLGAAEGTTPQVDGIEVGFDGVFKVGHWTPVWVKLTGGDSGPISVELVTPDTDGVATRFAAEDASIAWTADGTATALRYFKPGQVSGDLEVRVTQRGKVLASRRFSPGQFPSALPADQPLIVTCGGDIGLDETAITGPSSAPRTTPVLTLPKQLPDQWQGYEGVTVLAVPTSDPAFFDALTEQQIQAIRQWVQMGGRLLLCVGQRGDKVLAEQSPWRQFAPGRFSGVVPVRSASSLETYSGSREPLKVGIPGSPSLKMSRLTEIQGKVDLSESSTDGPRPIIARKPFGFGMVAMVTYDLDRPPFTTWDGTHRVAAKLLDRLLSPSGKLTAEEVSTGKIVHEGYRDLVGQLRTALDEFPGVSLVAFSWVACLALFYIVLIGPGDYFALNRLIRRMEWTWFTFPAIVLAFAAAAIALGYQFRGSELKSNQVDVIDFDGDSGFVRGTSWRQVYSPRTAAYDFAVESGWPGGAVGWSGHLLSWQGLPGTGLGGMSGQSPAATFAQSYALVTSPGSTTTTISGVPIAVSASKSLVSRSWGKTDTASKSRLRATADGLLVGEITNPLRVDLFEVTVLYENWYYRLDQTDGKLAAGQTTLIEGEHPFNLEWRLMRRRVKDTNDVRAPWDPASTDVPRILEMMMFHGAAGGTGYTQLSHSYQGFVDLSDHLSTGRAILSARCAVPALRMTIDGKEIESDSQQQWTFVRISLPVQPYSRPNPSPTPR